MKLLNSPTFRLRLRQFFFILGLGLFVYLIVRLKPSVIWLYLKTLGWNFVWIFLISLLWLVAYTLAWETFLKPLATRVHFFQLLKIKIVGEAVNNITPISWGGGDPARIYMLKEHLPLTEGTASVIVDRLVNNMALALFVLIGVIITLIRFSLPPTFLAGLLICLAIILAASVFMYVRSHEGIFEFILDLLKKLRLKKQFSDKTLKHAREIDTLISDFYKNNRRGFALAFTLHFFGKFCGVIEIYYAAQFIHHPLSWGDSYLIASMTIIVNMVFVFVPGSLGVMEGAFAGIFGLLNLNPAVGTSIQIIRRTRTLFWTGIGMALMGKKKRG